MYDAPLKVLHNPCNEIVAHVLDASLGSPSEQASLLRADIGEGAGVLSGTARSFGDRGVSIGVDDRGGGQETRDGDCVGRRRLNRKKRKHQKFWIVLKHFRQRFYRNWLTSECKKWQNVDVSDKCEYRI